MQTPASALVARMRQQRITWCDDIEPGKRVAILRPTETAMVDLVAGLRLDHAIAAVVDWGGFTEADLVGAGIGASDPVPFDAAAWDEWIRDHADAASRLLGRLSQIVSAYLQAKKDARGN